MKALTISNAFSQDQEISEEIAVTQAEWPYVDLGMTYTFEPVRVHLRTPDFDPATTAINRARIGRARKSRMYLILPEKIERDMRALVLLSFGHTICDQFECTFGHVVRKIAQGFDVMGENHLRTKVLMVMELNARLHCAVVDPFGMRRDYVLRWDGLQLSLEEQDYSSRNTDVIHHPPAE